MKTGLLYYDDDPGRSLVGKVSQAAGRYNRKFGARATTCYVHPSALDSPIKVGSIHIKALRTVLRHHFWVGVETEDGRT